jgi:hypothetical protein
MILYHQTTIKPKYQAMLHVNATAQTCQIVSITLINKKSKPSTDSNDDANAQILRTGDRGLVRFRFMQRAEYLKEGTKLIFREGRTKGLGTVKEIFPVKDSPISGPSSVSAPSESVNKSQVRPLAKDAGIKSVAIGRANRNHPRQNARDTMKVLK